MTEKEKEKEQAHLRMKMSPPLSPAAHIWEEGVHCNLKHKWHNHHGIQDYLPKL